MNFLKPKQDTFYLLFLDVGDDLQKISALFSELAHSFKNFDSFATRACAIEKSADEKTHRIIDELNMSFITPFDREDVYSLAHELDDVVDLTENVMRDIALYNFHEPIAHMKDFAKLFLDDAQLIVRMLTILPKMKSTQELQELKIRIHNNEDRGDELFAEGMKNLFKNEKDPIAIIKRKDILEGMELISDKYQDVSNIIEGIIIKHG